MGAQGTTTVSFATLPSTSFEASVTITGQSGIVSGSLVEAWIMPVATSDHDVDDHLYDPPRVIAGNIVAGTGFTIYAYVQDRFSMGGRPGQNVTYPGEDQPPGTWGAWTVAWVWN